MKEEKDEKEKNEKTEEKDSKVEGETKDDAMTTFKEKLRAAGHRLAKLAAKVVLSERKALEGRKVTAKIHGPQGLTGTRGVVPGGGSQDDFDFFFSQIIDNWIYSYLLSRYIF